MYSTIPKSMLIKSDKGNDYLVNRSIPQFMLLHPILNYIVELAAHGINMEAWAAELPDIGVTIEKGIHASKAEIIYYYKYYQFLLENGYFKEPQKIELTDSLYTAQSVAVSTANTRQISLEVCDTCGLNCLYCGYGELYGGYDNRKNQMMKPEMAKTFLDYMVELLNSPLNKQSHKDVVLSFYGGEPTDNMPLIKEMVAYAKNKKLHKKQFRFSITTNALSLEKHMDFFAENKIILLISLDGDRYHNSYRVKKNGVSSFDEVFKNIIALQKKHPQYFKTYVSFNAVIHNRNSHKEVVDFIRTNFDKHPMLSPLSGLGIKPEKREEFNQLYKQPHSDLSEADIKAYLNDSKRILQSPFTSQLFSFLRSYSGTIFFSYNKLLNKEENVPVVFPGTCHPFEKKIFLTVNGKLLVCESILQIFPMGRVDAHGVHIDYQNIADSYNGYYAKLKDTCNRCYNGTHCPVCIFMLNLKDKEPVCREFIGEDAFRDRLRESLTMLEEAPQFYLQIMKNYVHF